MSIIKYPLQNAECMDTLKMSLKYNINGIDVKHVIKIIIINIIVTIKKKYPGRPFYIRKPL